MSFTCVKLSRYNNQSFLQPSVVCEHFERNMTINGRNYMIVLSDTLTFKWSVNIWLKHNNIHTFLYLTIIAITITGARLQRNSRLSNWRRSTTDHRNCCQNIFAWHPGTEWRVGYFVSETFSPVNWVLCIEKMTNLFNNVRI